MRRNKQRFWDNVLKTEGCWLWQGGTSGGYPLFEGKLAHRTVYVEAYGSFPSGKPLACHTCDVPLCVRPDHLFAGSVGDNIRDALAKGRMPQAGHPISPEQRAAMEAGQDHEARHARLLARNRTPEMRAAPSTEATLGKLACRTGGSR